MAVTRERHFVLRVDGAETEDLYFIRPSAIRQGGLDTILSDIRTRGAKRYWCRGWFRSHWVGEDEMWAAEGAQLAAQPRSAERILDLFNRGDDDEDYPDWRPVHHYVRSRASCEAFIGALREATTTEQRYVLCYALSRRRRPCRRAVPWILPLLADPEEDGRNEAAAVLGAIMWRSPPPPAALSAQVGAALLAKLQDGADEQTDTLMALGETRWPPALEALTVYLARDDEGLRRASAFALGRLGAPGALPSLRRARDLDPSDWVREQIVKSIRALEAGM